MMRYICIFYFFIVLQSLAIGQSSRTMRLLKAGEFQKVLDYNFNRAEKTKNPIRFHQTMARAHALLGDDIQSEKEYKKALGYVNKKLDKKLKIRDFDIMDELALLSIRIGNWQQARELIFRSLRLRVKWWRKNDPINFRPYLPFGMLHFANGSLDSAKYYLNIYKDNLRNSNYTSHLDVDRYADVFQILADISLDENNLKKALQLSKKSFRLQRHVWTKKEAGKNYADNIKALNTITSIHIKMKEYTKAQKTNKRALEMLDKYIEGNQLLRIDTYLNQAFLEYRDQHVLATKKIITNVMSLQIEFVRKTMTYLSEYEKENIYPQFKINSDRILSQVYSLFDNEDIKKNDPLLIDVLNYIINTKAIILSETNKVINDTSDSLQFQLSNWKQLKHQWYYLTSVSKKRNRQKINEIHKEIVQIEKKLSNKLEPRQDVDWKSIQKKLGDDEIALEMIQIATSDTTDSFMVFKVTNDSGFPEVKQLKGDMSLDKYLRYYTNAIKHNIEDTITYKFAWQPIEISSKFKKIYISPSGIFHSMNFNTLKTPKGDFLVDRHKIVNVTNIARLINIDSEKQKFESAILMGISNFKKWRALGSSMYNFPDLPGVETEIYQIDSLLKKKKIITTSVLNDKATEKQLNEIEGYSILHLASHGFVDPNHANPMLSSGLLLEKTNSFNDGLLTAYEASLLNLKETQLVVLSACSSGLGNVVNGEGMYGLQRAFEVAGVNNIIVSMWNIDDSFTQYFMNAFYSNLILVNDVSIAFGETLIEVKDLNVTPRLWGAFKLVQCF